MIYLKRTVVAISSAILLISVFGALSAQAAELASPTIVITPDVYYPLDEVLYLEGQAEPNYVVELRFQMQGAKPLTYRTKSDSRGEWVLVEKINLKAGDWEVKTRTIDYKNNENISEWSNPRVFKVIVNGITIGGISIKFATLSLIIFILLILCAVAVSYFSYRVSRLKVALLDKEISEAQQSAHKSFSEMRQNMLEELRLLESRKRLSAEEIERKAHLLRDLENMERDLEKEIKDIEEKL